MTRAARTGVKIVFALFVLCVGIGIALTATLRSNRFKVWLLGEITQRSGYHVHADSLAFQLPLTVVADAVVISQPGQLQFKARQLRASASPFDLWSRTIHRLAIDQLTIEIDIDEISKTPSQGSTEIALRHLDVHNGRIILKRGTQTIFELENISLAAQDFNLAGPTGISLSADVPQLNGVAELRIKGQPRDLESDITLRPKRAKSLLDFGAAKIAQDSVQLHLKLRAPERQPINLSIDSKFHDLEIAGNKFTGTLNGKISADTKLSEANFTSAATLVDFANSLSAMSVKLPKGDLALNFGGNYILANKTLGLKSVKISAPFVSGAGEGQIVFGAVPTISATKFIFRDLPIEIAKAHLPAPLNRWSYSGQAQASVNLQGPWNALEVKGIVESDALQVRGDDLAVASLSFAAPFEWTKPAFRFKETKLQANKIAYSPKGRWQAGADKLQIGATFDYQADQPLKFAGRVDSSGMKFKSPDDGKVGENLSFNGPFEVIADGTQISVSGKFSADSGELLWGKFFGDLKTQKPVLEVNADYARAANRLDCRRCTISLASVGAIELGGAIENLAQTPNLHLLANSGNFSPGGFFEFFLRETFNRQFPVLDKLAIAGLMTFRLQLNGPIDGLAIAGEISLKDGELRTKSNDWRIGPMALNLPLQISLAESKPATAGTPRIGNLAIERIRFANQSIPAIATTLSLTNNALRVHQPIRLAIFGGEIEIANLFWPDLLKDPKQVSFSAETKRLKLEELTQALDWPRFSGTLTGSIPQIQSAENQLRTQGEIHAELFGGQLRMGKFEIDNPFSALAAIKLEAKFSAIQLEQLSQTFAFGRISGILEGSIDDLVLSDGQPSELRADIHSVDRGGEQRISVEALNKITVLSSGEDAGAVYGGLASFFDSFRYSKLGFKATLKNDRLQLRGVESRGDQEMLVVGSLLPPTVNIVSHTQTIAFSELLKRLERINKTDKPNVK
ncbi:MAG: hypothetical protein EXR70_20905 [Deltaproteobacteria bacterium]|nr:hypothetical protein [Deltaproteobacteria bacterium]